MKTLARSVDLALVAEIEETLQRVGCQYEFCEGPTLEPDAMVTCYRCVTLAQVRSLTCQPVRRPWETVEWARASQMVREYGYAHRQISHREALRLTYLRARNRELCEQYGPDPDRTAVAA
jgi:hypothetical protein